MENHLIIEKENLTIWQTVWTSIWLWDDDLVYFYQNRIDDFPPFASWKADFYNFFSFSAEISVWTLKLDVGIHILIEKKRYYLNIDPKIDDGDLENIKRD